MRIDPTSGFPLREESLGAATVLVQRTREYLRRPRPPNPLTRSPTEKGSIGSSACRRHGGRVRRVDKNPRTDHRGAAEGREETTRGNVIFGVGSELLNYAARRVRRAALCNMGGP